MTDKMYDLLTAPKVTAAEVKAKRRARAERLSAAIPGAIRYDVPRVQSSPSDRMSAAIADVDELDREIADLKDRMKNERRAIVDAADQFLDYQERRVIIPRYIDRASWSCIASVLHRSKSTIHRIHRSAGEKLSTICG